MSMGPWERDGTTRLLFEGQPLTPRETRIARVAWCEGNRSSCDREPEAAARHLYPMPKVKRPVRVTLSDSSVWSFDPDTARSPGGVFQCHTPALAEGTWATVLGLKDHIVMLSDARELARMLSGETEEVDAE